MSRDVTQIASEVNCNAEEAYYTSDLTFNDTALSYYEENLRPYLRHNFPGFVFILLSCISHVYLGRIQYIYIDDYSLRCER